MNKSSNPISNSRKSRNPSSNDKEKFTNKIIILLISFLALSILASTQKIGWPVWEMLTGYNDVFTDFNGDRMENTNTYFHMTPEYGVLAPGGVWIGYFFSFFTLPSAVWVFQLLALGSTVLSLQFLLGNRSIAKPFIVVVCSFPFLFAYFRGNNDIWQFPMLAFFVALISKGRFTLAAVCIGLIASVEPYNAVFATLLLAFGCRYLFQAGATGFLVLISLQLIGSRDVLLYIKDFQYTSDWYTKDYILGNGGLLANNSLWGLGKFILFQIFNTRSQEIINNVYPLFAVLSLLGITLSILIVYLNRKKNRLHESFSLLSVAIVLFAPTSATYKLVILMLVVVIMLVLNESRESSKWVILLTITVIPKNWIWFRWPDWQLGLTLDTVINPILLILVWYSLSRSLLSGVFKKSYPLSKGRV